MWVDHARWKGIAVTVEEVIAAFRRYSFSHVDEDELQQALGMALDRAGIPYDREVRLSAHSRIDFLVHGGVGIEVKVKGSAHAAGAQMLRYARSDKVTSLLLVTDRVQAGAQPETLNGKPVAVFQILGGIL